LLQLIQEQTSFNKNSSFVVKSLCNIAQKSADLFRFDFEYICLEKARELGPSDTWTMIQLGDHFKRLGKYEEAIEILTLAKEHGDWAMANSGIADVYSQMGRYEEAIRIYKSLPNWESEPEINTAIADILRKTGNFEEARSGYINLIKLAHQNPVKFAPSEIRARVGLAEIEKSQGHLQQALASYESIINESSFPPKDGLVYRLTKCRILKNLGRLAEAFEISDQVALEFPFSSEARFTRGALLGLIGKPSEGLEDFSQNYSENSLRKWLRYFFSGLLLLKINSFEQARTNLLEELPKAINCNDDLAVSRMSAVVYFLRSNQIKEAQNLIVKIPEIVDYNQNYLSLVLKLHLAAKDSDKAKVKHFVNLIESLTPFCEQIHEAIGFIRCGNFEEATLLEIDSLLQLVA
jgi:tetratricopeptide (TPR) repeat protein